MNAHVSAEISAEAYLRRLAERGIEYVFANAGTDFAPIIEALSRGGGKTYPRFVTVPHENVAMAMAHGYYRVSGKPAVVMVHVNVGTANALCGLMNAARDNVPTILAAGRTPLTETGHIASRNGHIHWGQESFDQGGMVREFVKWDYELRHGQPVDSVVDRAIDIAMSEPRGPVYMTLPREVLADSAVAPRRATIRAAGAVPAQPAPSAIEDAARLIANAGFPLIVTANAGRNPEAFANLARLADSYAIPVVQFSPSENNLATDHPMHLGYEPGALLAEADIVLVLDSTVPWIPKSTSLRRGAKIIHVSADPLASRYPFREFEADHLIAGETRAALSMLHHALRELTKGKETVIENRRTAVAAKREAMLAKRQSILDTARAQTPIHPFWLTTCLNEVKAKNAILVNELGINIGPLEMTEQGSYLSTYVSGGLGFGLGAALGAKLAAPERDVIAVVGDGSYMFGNPLSYHFVGHAEKLPILTVIANNHSWHAVRNSTLAVYPDGDAAKSNVMPLTLLEPSPSFEKTIDVYGGHGEKVERPEDLPAALRRGMEAVRAGMPAVINVHTRGRH
jgi:acetolactate synthase-1/2/3 large subunit